MNKLYFSHKINTAQDITLSLVQSRALVYTAKTLVT